MWASGTKVSSGGAVGFDSKTRLSREITGQTISPTTWTKVEWDTERYDTLGEGDIASTYRITVQETGYYHISCNIVLQGMGADRDVTADIRLNGGSLTANGQGSAGQAGASVNAVSATPYYLSANDYVEVWVYQNDTVDRTLAGGSFLSVERFA